MFCGKAFPEMRGPDFEQVVVADSLFLEVEVWVEQADDLVDCKGLHGC